MKKLVGLLVVCAVCCALSSVEAGHVVSRARSKASCSGVSRSRSAVRGGCVNGRCFKAVRARAVGCSGG